MGGGRRMQWRSAGLVLLMLLSMPLVASDSAPAGTEAAEPSLDERLDALLAEVADESYGERRRCLSRYQYRSVKVLNVEYLLFSRGDAHWLNRLKLPCPSLKFNDLPVFESRGMSSNCQGDPFYPTNSMDLQQGLDPTGRPRASYGVCYLGDFQLISAEQAALLMAP